MTEHTGQTHAQNLDDIEWFETAGRPRGPRHEFPTARVNGSGHLALNRLALEELGDPTHITFGYSRRLGLVALRPSTTAQVSAYKLQPTSKESSHLNFGAFMKAHALDRMRRKTYRVSITHGMGLIAPDDPVVSS